MSEGVEAGSAMIGSDALGLGADLADRLGHAAAEWADLAGGFAACLGAMPACCATQPS